MDVRYEKAKQLRSQGYSYNEIYKILGVPKSTQSGWFKDFPLSEEARTRINKKVEVGVLNGLVKRNKAQTLIAQERNNNIFLQAKDSIKNFLLKDLFFVGVALYWAEGYKRPVKIGGREVTHHSISFTNSDGEMIKFFMLFLRKCLEIEESRIRLNLRLFDRKQEKQAIFYWLNVTGLKRESLGKISYVKSLSSQSKRQFNRLPFGTIAVRVSDTKKFHQLIGFIAGVKGKLADLLKNS